MIECTCLFNSIKLVPLALMFVLLINYIINYIKYKKKSY